MKNAIEHIQQKLRQALGISLDERFGVPYTDDSMDEAKA